MIKVIDLHVHTTASDGSFTPTQTVELAKKAGLVAMAVTDHDTVDGIDEAISAANGSKLEIVPGVEISVGDTDNIHILGLYINPSEEHFHSVMEQLRSSREERNKNIIKKLQGIGIDITYEDVKEKMNADNVGRLHIAYYLKNKGVVNDYRKAFKKYLIPGAFAYASREHISEKNGIEAILHSGGIPFLAHINYLKMNNDDIENTVKKLMGYGLMGVEAYYSGYDKKTEAFAHSLCEKYGLLKSGGTDFHGTRRRGVYLGTGRGNMCVPYEYLIDIKNKIR